jgi:hypothetical protein
MTKEDFVLARNSASTYPSYKELKDKEKQEVAVSALWCQKQWPGTGILSPVLQPTTKYLIQILTRNSVEVNSNYEQ